MKKFTANSNILNNFCIFCGIYLIIFWFTLANHPTTKWLICSLLISIMIYIVFLKKKCYLIISKNSLIEYSGNKLWEYNWSEMTKFEILTHAEITTIGFNLNHKDDKSRLQKMMTGSKDCYLTNNYKKDLTEILNLIEEKI